MIKMARPIQPTPTLRGKDAERFLRDIKRREKYGPTKKEKKFLEECDEVYEKVTHAKFWKWFDKNLIYCEDTHSFVHRLYDKIKAGKTAMGKKMENHHGAQYWAFDIIKEMKEEFDKKRQ